MPDKEIFKGNDKIKDVKTILFPSSYFDWKKVDEDLQNEYDAVLATGLWDVIIFSYDKWFNEGKLSLSREVSERITAVYRGWMMKADQYADFFVALKEKNIELTTTPEEYEHFHYFPNVYQNVRRNTPEIITVPLDEPYDLDEIKSHFGKFMVKDFVKSVKGTDFPKYFTKDVTERDFKAAMEIFYKYRGNLLAGGLCFKEYVDLKRYGDKTNEYRVFYIGNKIASICRNSLQQDYTPEPPKEMLDEYSLLHSTFYTLDYAELEDGRWMILEAGDGGVSGPSEGQDLEAFYRAMYHCYKYDLTV